MYVMKSAALGRVLTIYMALLWVQIGQPWLDSNSVEHNAIKNRFGTVGQKVTPVQFICKNVRILAF
jgi:hypothetical protein